MALCLQKPIEVKPPHSCRYFLVLGISLSSPLKDFMVNSLRSKGWVEVVGLALVPFMRTVNLKNVSLLPISASWSSPRWLESLGEGRG